MFLKQNRIFELQVALCKLKSAATWNG